MIEEAPCLLLHFEGPEIPLGCLQQIRGGLRLSKRNLFMEFTMIT